MLVIYWGARPGFVGNNLQPKFKELAATNKRMDRLIAAPWASQEPLVFTLHNLSLQDRLI